MRCSLSESFLQRRRHHRQPAEAKASELQNNRFGFMIVPLPAAVDIGIVPRTRHDDATDSDQLTQRPTETPRLCHLLRVHGGPAHRELL